jgi:hypothetical protein
MQAKKHTFSQICHWYTKFLITRQYIVDLTLVGASLTSKQV